MSSRGWNKGSGSSSERRWKPDYETQKQNDAYDRFAEMMIDKISSFKGDWKKPWISEGQMLWPKSLYGKTYNGMNALMLMFHCEKEEYKIPVFATHERVFSLNFKKGDTKSQEPVLDENGEKRPFVHVLKGEKSFPVFLSQVVVKEKDSGDKISYADYLKLSKEEQEKYKLYYNSKVYYVFNVDQTNIKDARPELYEKLKADFIVEKPKVEGEVFTLPAVDQMIKENLWVCPIQPKHGDDCYYSPSRDVIVTPEKEQFISGEHYYGNTFHEMIHSTGHERRLNRLGNDSFGSPGYAKEELVAELGAALEAQRHGMDKYIKVDSVSYLSGWLKKLQEEPSFIKNVLNDVKAATHMLHSKIEESERMLRGEKLDLREAQDDEESLGSDLDGDGQVNTIGSISPDKKQGEEEHQEKEKEQTTQEEHHRRGGFHR